MVKSTGTKYQRENDTGNHDRLYTNEDCLGGSFPHWVRISCKVPGYQLIFLSPAGQRMRCQIGNYNRSTAGKDRVLVPKFPWELSAGPERANVIIALKG